MARPQDNTLEIRLGSTDGVTKSVNWNVPQFKGIKQQMAQEKADYNQQVESGFTPDYMYPTDYSKFIKKAVYEYIDSRPRKLLDAVRENNKIARAGTDNQEMVRDIVMALHSEMQTMNKHYSQIIEQQNQILEQNKEIRMMQDFIIEQYLQQK